MLGLAGPVRGSSIYMMALLKAVSLLDSLVAMVVGSVRRGSLGTMLAWPQNFVGWGWAERGRMASRGCGTL